MGSASASGSGSGGACPRHFALFCSVVFVLSIFFSSAESYPNPLTDCEDYGDYIQGSALFSTLCGAHWRNQEQEQIQNVFKRSHSVHPLMRLSPKLSLRRKKQQKLKRVCGVSGRRIRDVFCPYLGSSAAP
ncbi:uncharacterized protein LOC109060488 isoform X3 [Cyprinus carpio]|uniref:Uncharacterized protein LOC109060488 isoform X3 n=1 Tax=Cyprinus carpio TaxID=7962 RepID=A0A9Q9YHJ3_CYPCA|nr:uncharacterized protein LOC109060488 isoform X3 [Cyprinus carpio]